MKYSSLVSLTVVGLASLLFAGDGHDCSVHKKGEKAAVECKHDKKCKADLEACKAKCNDDAACIKKCDEECKVQCKLKKTSKTDTASATKVSVQTTCPVMGSPIDKNQYVDVRGKRIYVCCAGCIEPIKKDPDLYLKKLTDEGVTVEDVPAK